MKNRIPFIFTISLLLIVFLLLASILKQDDKGNSSYATLPTNKIIVNVKKEDRVPSNKNPLKLASADILEATPFEDLLKKFDAKFLLKDSYNDYYLSQNSLAIKWQDYRSFMGKKIQEREGKWIIYAPASKGPKSDSQEVKSYPVILGSSQGGILIPLRTLKIFLKDKNFEESAKSFIEQYADKIEKTDYLSEIKTIYVHATTPGHMMELYQLCLSENNSSEYACAPEFYQHLKFN
ncbi:MAG: hypothetical protein QE271_00540 [Bacteriovoracaceae bacterium]|nr:hypothetical protein [Bacteriovoracaceae bacterium]